MSKRYRSWNPEQNYLLPPSPQDWLPENDLVYFIMDTVRTLDLTAITAKYEAEVRGQPPYNPTMMVTLLLYGYSQGVFSSRKIQKRCERDAAFRVIVQGDVPNFRTISDFRKLHLKELEDLFVQVLTLCREAGLVKLGHVSLDGTKVKANASRHKAMSYARMVQDEKRLHEEMRELLERSETTDRKEDKEHGSTRRGDELPEELARREQRLERIQAARKSLEAKAKAAAEEAEGGEGKPRGGGKKRRVVPHDKAQYNFTDPETSIMKVNNKGFDQCGNAQAVVDRDHQVILAADVTNQSNDKRQLQPMVEQARANLEPEAEIRRFSCDAGYFSEENVVWAEEQGLDAYISPGRQKHNKKAEPCPQGRPPSDLTIKEKMARKLRTKDGRSTYAERKWICEPVFGQLKRGLGFTQFLLNGIQKMKGEFRLVCLSHNLRKLHAAVK